MFRAKRILGRRFAPSIAAPMGMIAGYVTCYLRDAETDRVERVVGPFRNLITNAALDFFGTNVAANVLALGASTDATAPANADTVMAGEFTASTNRTTTVGPTASSITYVAAAPDYYSAQWSRRFATTQANGVITKLGMFSAATGGTLLAETFVKDASGNATTITKTSAQTLDVIWEFRWYLPQTDAVTTPTINGTVYTITARACNVGVSGKGWGSAIGQSEPPELMSVFWSASNRYMLGSALVARNATPTAVAATLAIAALAYTNGSSQRDTTFSCSTTAVTSILQTTGGLANNAYMQIGFSPVLPQNQQITIRQSWARYP